MAIAFLDKGTTLLAVHFRSLRSRNLLAFSQPNFVIMQFLLPGNILAIFDLNACGENRPHVHFVASSTPEFLRITELKWTKKPTNHRP